MGSQSSKAKYEKMVSELGYLEADLEYHQAIMNESQAAFEEALDETAKKKGVNLNRGKPKSKKGPPPQRSTKKNKKRKPNNFLMMLSILNLMIVGMTSQLGESMGRKL